MLTMTRIPRTQPYIPRPVRPRIVGRLLPPSPSHSHPHPLPPSPPPTTSPP